MITYDPFPEMTPLRKQLHDIYELQGLNREDGRKCPSYSQCSASCRWFNKNIYPPTASFVGDIYETYGILFVGINTNKGSDSSETFYSSYAWISKDKTESSPYIDGAIYRIMKKIMKTPDADSIDTRKRFAFSNIIKCSVEKDAGNPTNVMHVNCAYRHNYIASEIGILIPRVIIALGEPPFATLRDLFIESAKPHDSKYHDWIFSFTFNEENAIVIGLNNPGQGYITTRGILKDIKANKQIKEQWRIFWPEEIKNNEQMIKYLNCKYADKLLVDKNNPFYELMVDVLLETALKEANLT